MNTKTFIPIFLTLIAILIISVSGCERIQQVILSEPVPSDTVSTVKVGVIQPSGLAPNFTKGAELARSQINEAGGLLGMQVEFIVMDNQGERDFPDAAESVRIAQLLIEQEGVVAILGPLLSTNSMQVGPVVSLLRRPIITGSSGEKVTSTGEFVFITVTPSSVQGMKTAQFALDPTELNAKTAATIRQAGDVYSGAVADAFEENFQKRGGELVASEVYQHGDRDFTAQLTKIKAGAPDVLLVAGFSPEIPLFALQARNMGVDATFIGTNGWDEPDKLLGTLDDNAPLEGSYFTRGFNIESVSAAAFVKAYTAMYMEPPDGPSAWGYDAMSLLALAIENAETLEPDTIRHALANTMNYQGATTISHFDENRHPVKYLELYTIRNGKIELYKVITP
ncbi:MAG: ABC transporter substrate-binding protein [Candidatus Poribacteria bacterium]|nr:ABC transporter substrate-binding protein [Candidatus Poribacteria bacterium]